MWSQKLDSVILVHAFQLRMFCGSVILQLESSLSHPGGAEAETALFLPSEPIAAPLQGTAGGSAPAKHLTGSNGSVAAGQLPRGSAHSPIHMAEPAIPTPAQPGAPG